jgi:hypothetical protein
VDAPPELLNWARDTKNGITHLIGLARRREVAMIESDLELLRRHERDLDELLARNRSTNPADWVIQEDPDRVE